ncbi:MAG: carboxymuconolactone decarboxylase family protein [Peptococcaceae bacterium]|nr:carboxymuconolactone decarboxylase family protein [Peptococcaceae bacterium]
MALPVALASLKTGDAEFYEVLNALKEMSLDAAVLDKRTKFLIGLAVNFSLERADKVQCALAQARAAGATEEEVRETMHLAYFIKGLPTAQIMAQVFK